MKKIFALGLFSCLLVSAATVHAQDDKSKRPSPPATVSRKLASGATISIDYSQPSLKGRTIGKDVEPMKGQVWRAGANEATVFQTDKAVTVDGQALPAGKYALFMRDNGSDWTIIFNKVWKTWGAFDYDKNKASDALQLTVQPQTSDKVQEKLTYTIDESGKVTLLWGNRSVAFTVK
ncbi:MAG: DUF2911 domain-containing protein [Flavisolibacter sp.]